MAWAQREVLGHVLQGRRDQVVLCTKFGVWSGWPDVTVDHSADRIGESVEASLRRLRTDYLDVLQASPLRVVSSFGPASGPAPRAIFADAARLGVGLIGNIPLESGWLSGKYAASSEFDGARSRWSPSDIAHRAALVEEFRALLPQQTLAAIRELGSDHADNPLPW